MKLGVLTAPFPDRSLEQVADWAVAEGFATLEVACWPVTTGAVRRYAGTTHIDADRVNGPAAKEIAAMLAEKGIEISGLGYYPNPLHPEAEAREMALGHLRKLVTLAAEMGVGVVNTFAGGDQRLTLEDNWSRAREIFPEIVAFAKDHGVRLAFENCPMIFSNDEWPGGHNIAYSPWVWRRILEEWDGAVGINFDPSHLVWQFIDMGRFIREFGAQFAHVHAKDLMIDRDGLYERGTMSLGMGWQVPRMPGLGDVDWGRFFSELYRVGYDGPVIIEHEDRRFEGSEEKLTRGFRIARDVLSPYIK